MLLSQMKENEICEIVAVKDGCHIKNRLSELGISKGQKIEVYAAPLLLIKFVQANLQ